MARASRKRNVVPAAAEVEYDCRVLPGTEPEELLGEFRTALAGLDVELELAERRSAARARRFDTPLRDALAEWVDELEPGALLVPEISRASPTRTSCARPSARSPTVSSRCAIRPRSCSTRIHAPDERIDVRDLELAVRAFVHCIDRIGSVTA